MSGPQGKVLFHSNEYGFGSGYYSGTTGNRGYPMVQQRVADCADGVGSKLTGSADVGNRTLSALIWNGSGQTRAYYGAVGATTWTELGTAVSGTYSNYLVGQAAA